ncbi:hypothetical protein BG015_003584 [Linnemannia schmuckeri]|uniref:Transposase n=1 Tax=Linnemannia schmuckeri TaxID=64567 RepID=A0A9P5S9F3_9FUNG|nr:hypothetical protein BG015_003584 [Linnemannia schmuckeri]
MPKHHSIELKGRIVGAYEAGATPSSIAKAHNLRINTVLAIIKKWEQEGTIVPKKPPGGRPILGDQDVEQLLDRVKDSNCATLQEIIKLSPKPVSESTIRRILRKKKIFCHAPVKRPRLTPRQRKLNGDRLEESHLD